MWKLGRLSALAPWIGGLIAALPVLVWPYPPMTDFPHHEAIVALLRQAHDTSLYPAGMYIRNLGQPNQLFHLLAWPLASIVSVTLACRLVLAMSLVAIPVCGARLARHFGASPWVGLVLVPISLGWLFTWGFVSNLLGLTVLCAFLPALDDLAEKATPSRLALAVLGTVLLYEAHELIMFVYVGAGLLFAISRRLELRRTALAALPSVVGLALAFAQIRLQEHLKTDTVSMVPNLWTPLVHKLRSLPFTLVGTLDPFARWLLFAGSIGAVLALAVAGHRARRGATDADRAVASSDVPAERIRAWLCAHRLALLAAGTFGLYLLAPLTYNGAALVHQRFLAPAFFLAACALAAGSAGVEGLVAKIACAAVPLAAVFPLLEWFGAASGNYKDVEALLELIPRKSSVAAVELDRDQGGRPFAVISHLSRVLVHRGGRVLYSLSESTVAPVICAPALQWNEPSSRVAPDNSKLRPAHDLTRFRYLLLHGSSRNTVLVATEALWPEARPIAMAGEWMLFESKLEVVPIDAPDAPLPSPKPATLGRRMQDVVRALQEAAPVGAPAGEPR